MEQPTSNLQELPPQCIDEAAKLAAAAFLHSPSYCYIFEGLTEAKRREALEWLFRKNFMIRLGGGVTRCAFVGDQMVCFFMLLTPSSSEIGVWKMLRAGILQIIRRYGFRSLIRLLEVKAYHERVGSAFLSDLQRPVKHTGGNELEQTVRGWCQLERMVVHPAWQGRGIGSRCLCEALEEVTAQGWGGVTLSTQESKNVKFYERCGFGVMRSETHHGVTNYFMAFRSDRTTMDVSDTFRYTVTDKKDRCDTMRIILVGLASTIAISMFVFCRHLKSK